MWGRFHQAVSDSLWSSSFPFLAKRNSPDLGGDLKLALFVTHAHAVLIQFTLRKIFTILFKLSQKQVTYFHPNGAVTIVLAIPFFNNPTRLSYLHIVVKAVKLRFTSFLYPLLGQALERHVQESVAGAADYPDSINLAKLVFRILGHSELSSRIHLEYVTNCSLVCLLPLIALSA